MQMSPKRSIQNAVVDHAKSLQTHTGLNEGTRLTEATGIPIGHRLLPKPGQHGAEDVQHVQSKPTNVSSQRLGGLLTDQG